MKSDKKMNKVFRYIELHLEEAISVNELATFSGYSKYYFLRKFKKYTGRTVMDYVTNRRLIEASKEIIYGEKIMNVAYKYGWKSHSGFTRTFIREYGFPPVYLKNIENVPNEVTNNSMSHAFLASTIVGSSKEELFLLLKKKIQENKIMIDEEKLEETYKLSCSLYSGVNRYSGEEYITHLLNIAIILTEFEVEESVLYASLFCDVSKKVRGISEESFNVLDIETKEIILKLQERNVDVEDEEIILIKLAERLHNMRTIDYLSLNLRKEKARENMNVFFPLARSLVNAKLVDELVDLSIRYYEDREKSEEDVEQENWID